MPEHVIDLTARRLRHERSREQALAAGQRVYDRIIERASRERRRRFREAAASGMTIEQIAAASGLDEAEVRAVMEDG